MSRRRADGAETLRQAADDMGRVLDVVDAMHNDAPEYAATIIEAMGIDRCALASLRLLDVVLHVIATERPNGAAIDVADVTDYLRTHLGREGGIVHV